MKSVLFTLMYSNSALSSEKKESLLPDKPANEQYEFAVSFMKIGDYETAEFALKEFIQKNNTVIFWLHQLPRYLSNNVT